jgi:hypothetical protein
MTRQNPLTNRNGKSSSESPEARCSQLGSNDETNGSGRQSVGDDPKANHGKRCILRGCRRRIDDTGDTEANVEYAHHCCSTQSCQTKPKTRTDASVYEHGPPTDALRREERHQDEEVEKDEDYERREEGIW